MLFSPDMKDDLGTEVVRRLSQRRHELEALSAALVRVPSFTGAERALAEAVLGHLADRDLEGGTIDAAGNVVYHLKGRRPGPCLVLVTHLDTAAPGPSEAWLHDPLAGLVDGPWLHGLGVASCKGAMAAQIEAVAALAQLGWNCGDLVLAAVVHSERAGCLGSQYLLEHTLPAMGLRPEAVVLGDPTGLAVHLGHRGRAELEIETFGRTSHASVPWLGQNAAYKMMPVLEALEDLQRSLPSHPLLERSTVALTGLVTRPDDGSRIPDRCVATIDRRYLPGESLDAVVGQIRTILNKVAHRDSAFLGDVRIREEVERTWTGLERSVPRVMAPWLTREDHPVVRRALVALRGVGQEPRLDKWSFGTDGSYAAGALGLPTIGYGPGEEATSHTPGEKVALEAVAQAAVGYAAVARAFCEESHGL
ncbi:MAG: M20/M25/M40 family metallo-hydrolase [Candidatus Sericytochromatia bacterium]|nr:M20/M25/M40 family metallo-hydrolase [Candidatus Sericytochromatia bacterium]